MAEIGFYHLTRTRAAEALPQLLGRLLEQGARAVVRCGDAERLAALDRGLWECAKPVWLPHGTSYAALQPIYLTVEDERPNGAKFLFLLHGTESARLGEYLRVIDLFDGTDQGAVAAARGRWSRAKAGGHGLSYWQQSATGWDRRAG